jgi:hypothetical protein
MQVHPLVLSMKLEVFNHCLLPIPSLLEDFENQCHISCLLQDHEATGPRITLSDFQDFEP